MRVGARVEIRWGAEIEGSRSRAMKQRTGLGAPHAVSPEWTARLNTTKRFRNKLRRYVARDRQAGATDSERGERRESSFKTRRRGPAGMTFAARVAS